LHERRSEVILEQMSGHSAPVETEWTLLLAACSDHPAKEKTDRIRRLLHSPIQWTKLVDLADRHGVQPILTQAVGAVEDQVPAEALNALKQSYQANLRKALLLSREFVSIVDRLSQAGLEFMPYKGLALAETVYGDIALRQSGDIDLLIHATDLPRVRKAVAELGYRPHQLFSADEQEAYLRSGYESAFDGPAGKNLLEVQWAIQPRFYAVNLEMEGLFRRAVKATVVGVEVKTLCIEDLFVVLALHAAKHVWGKLIWLCDLARITCMPALDWKRIGDQARELGIVRILRVTLQLAKKLLDTPVPAIAQENLPEDLAAASLAREIEGYVVSDRTFDVESRAYFSLMLRLRERRLDRMRFLSRLAFTPGPSEWAITRLPKPLFPFYQVLRITRLGARLVSGRI
jgi:putative nucleotidyltransferase-like protein